MKLWNGIFDKYALKARKLQRAAFATRIYLIRRKHAAVPERSNTFQALFKERSEKHKAELLDCAERIISGEYAFLGLKISNEISPDWHRDYLSGFIWPHEIYYQVRQRTPANVDIKNVWELSSFIHLLPVALAYGLRSDVKFRDFVLMTIRGWNLSNPCPIGVNWCNPMVAAIRLMNLIEAVSQIERSGLDVDTQRMVDILVWEHLQFIHFNYENLGSQPGNHYVANLVGVLWGSLYFSELHPWVRRIRKSVLKNLSKEIFRQVHEDGTHFEGSTNYHRLVTELFARAALFCQKNDVQLPREFHGQLFRMFRALDNLVLPNGMLPLIGDNDDGRVFYGSEYFSWNPRDPGYLMEIGSELFKEDFGTRTIKAQDSESHRLMHDGKNSMLGHGALGRWLPIRHNRLRTRQFWVYKNKSDYIAVNCGNPGRRHSGHSHNHTLGFVCCFNGTEVIVDPGSFVYTRDPDMRNLFRSTAYHNVVQLDGMEQCEIDAKKIFVLERRFSPTILQITKNNGYFYLDAESEGFRHFCSAIEHRRKFNFSELDSVLHIEGSLVPKDGMESMDAIHNVDSYLHLSREVHTALRQPGSIEICKKNNREPVCLATWDDNAAVSVTVEDYWLSERYGQREISQKIVFRTRTHLPYQFSFSLEKI